jgi:hypothetical protein
MLDDAPPNNGMHPTADTTDFIYINGAGRRVMPGVRLLARCAIVSSYFIISAL